MSFDKEIILYFKRKTKIKSKHLIEVIGCQYYYYFFLIYLKGFFGGLDLEKILVPF